jgi:L-seryl-tRNA(Ser) seleniumtransferase
MPTKLLAIPVTSPNRFLAELRHLNPPIIGRVQDGKVVLDPRSILPEQDKTLVSLLKEILFSQEGNL